MVLLVPCFSATLASPSSHDSNCKSVDLFYEVPSSLRPSEPRSRPQTIPSMPVPIRLCEESPLSTSADSVSSFRSSCSNRSSAEREAERAARRRLLDVSVSKLHAQRDQPLRKYLLIFNTIKSLQRDLDMLDDEELYCSLMDDDSGSRMEVDECPWPQPEVHQEQENMVSIITHSNESVLKNAWENEEDCWHAEPAPLQPLNSIQEAFGSWWSGNSSNSERFEGASTGSVAGCWGASLSVRGSSLADDQHTDLGAPSIWGHLDDLDANPLGQSWLSARELSSLFSPHLHHSNSELLMQA